jgi:2-hydroxy-3-keto-5-methylthiopentenyl-1-phosphate phosphatase
MPIAWLCDFDGTVSPSDIGAAFVERFSGVRNGTGPVGARGEASRAGAAALVPELAGWLAGRVGHRELTRAQCARVRATREDALAFTRGFALDPSFAGFVEAAIARGDAVMVVSEGFDFYIQDQLERAGLGSLPRAANQLVFRADGSVEPEFPHADPACDDCGNCKARHVRRYRAEGFHTVLVGDGLSDRHGALAADQVVARGSLRAWCEAERLPHRAFPGFGALLDDGDAGRAIRERASARREARP